MKKLAMFLAVFMMASSAYANDALVSKMNSNKALTKFGRGVTNVATSATSSYTNSQVASFGTRFFRVLQLP